MFLQQVDITKDSFVTDIVKLDYRAANVFRKYDIEFCCGGRWPLGLVCETKDLNFISLKNELQDSFRNIKLSNTIEFHKWNIDFLIDYIINIHHNYLLNTLPVLWVELKDFAEEHSSTDPKMGELLSPYSQLQKEGILHIRYEEEVIFPYLRQVAHAYHNKDSFASLLVKTLRKPIKKFLEEEHEIFTNNIHKFRTLTNNYTPPEGACTHHKVVLSQLLELDNDLAQHIRLEKDILFPRVIEIEKELLEQNNNPS